MSSYGARYLDGALKQKIILHGLRGSSPRLKVGKSFLSLNTPSLTLTTADA